MVLRNYLGYPNIWYADELREALRMKPKENRIIIVPSYGYELIYIINKKGEALLIGSR